MLGHFKVGCGPVYWNKLLFYDYAKVNNFGIVDKNRRNFKNWPNFYNVSTELLLAQQHKNQVIKTKDKDALAGL